MTEPTIHISAHEADASQDDRFHRFRLIGWWDQNRLAAARVLVIGAGALGNEIVKNLALLGVGNVLIADMDRIENSNLSRSVLYRQSDNGQPKALVAARAAQSIYPGMKTHAFDGNIVYDLGLGAYRWADVIIGGLDNREARLAINRACYKVNRPWIDGAIEQIQGTARLFAPPHACYECTMSQTDWRLLQMRRSCNLLSRSEMQLGKTPTTPTISSIIAGIQCQEAVKLLHGLSTIAGKGIVFEGLSADCYTIEYQRNKDCLSHDPLGDIKVLAEKADTITLGQLLEHARALLGADAHLELPRDVLSKLVCPHCGTQQEIFCSLGKIKTEQGQCPQCHQMRDVRTFHRINGDETFLDRTVAQIGLPPFEIITARAADGRSIGLELGGDAPAVLGELRADEQELDWT
ncbi:MAG: ThiF family adenylyltransferase [Phycisphaerales bacterium]|nr:ThiF family adenylyltransferase [Phycisphaerales bacterium]